MRKSDTTTVAIVIGRNEGARLTLCIRSLLGQVDHIVYVDSASADSSVNNARDMGALVVSLSTGEWFSAARARNQGYRFAQMHLPPANFVLFVDGDCEVDRSWVQLASEYLTRSPQYAIACGRREEKDIARSRYNRFCDIEWDTPVGDADTCGGDIMIRNSALSQVEGYCEELIAGEEPEMCVRLRKLGWKISRLNARMTYHDADITRFSQWWRRAVRAGYAFVSVWCIHKKSGHTLWERETCSAIFWSMLLPLVLLATLVKPMLATLLILYPVQIVRIWLVAIRSGDSRKQFDWAFFLMLGKFAEAYGISKYVTQRLLNRDPEIYEYK